jgi:transposase IS66 family protein
MEHSHYSGTISVGGANFAVSQPDHLNLSAQRSHEFPSLGQEQIGNSTYHSRVGLVLPFRASLGPPPCSACSLAVAASKPTPSSRTLLNRLTRFLVHPILELSTNAAENAIRPVALGRKYERLGIRQSWDGEENSHLCCAVVV